MRGSGRGATPVLGFAVTVLLPWMPTALVCGRNRSVAAILETELETPRRSRSSDGSALRLSRCSVGDAGRAENLDAILGRCRRQFLEVWWFGGRRRDRQARCGFGQGAHEGLEAGGFCDE